MPSKRGTSVTTTVGDDLLKFLDRYADMRAISRGQALRECCEITQRISASYAVTVNVVAKRRLQER